MIMVIELTPGGLGIGRGFVMIIAGTGHRPDKLGGYADDVQVELIKLARSWMQENKPTKVISGMAVGWDLALATAALKEKIPFIAAVPFYGQENVWPRKIRDVYNNYLLLAEQIIIVCQGGYGRWKFQRRNVWMVDHCDMVLALWNGSPGGTENCVKYAQKSKKPIINLWETYKEILSGKVK